MIVWQVTPLSRPQQAARVVREFNNQTLPREHRRLCLVVNGSRCEGFTPPDADLVLRSGPGKPAALNTALEALTGELIAIRDDDDVSLPGDLQECLEAFKSSGSEIVSRLRHHVVLDGERWLFSEGLADQWGNHAVWGGSLVFRATSDVPAFPGEHVTESQSWARLMVGLGARIWRPSTENQIHVRQSYGGMWGAGPLEVRRTLGFKRSARKYLADGSFEWVPCPSALAVCDEVSERRLGILAPSGRHPSTLQLA